jgi:uncharacterized phage-associated protein
MKLSEQKRINAILFFATKSPDYKIKRLKLMKLLWLADRIHLNRYGRMILRDNYYALPHGPVPSKAMDLSKESVADKINVVDYTIEAEDIFDSKYFSETDIQIMNEVWDTYGGMKERRLRDLSHEFPEWKRYEDELENKELPNGYLMILGDFFKPPVIDVMGYSFDEERAGLAKKKFESYNKIQKALTSA